MTITFSGARTEVNPDRKRGEAPTMARVDDPAITDEDDPGFNLSNANAMALARLLGLPAEPIGEVSIYEARRAVIRARATFDSKVDGETREPSDTKKPGHCRVIEGGISREYLAARVQGFSELIERLANAGATHIVWS